MSVQMLLAGMLFSSVASARSVDGIPLSLDEVQLRDGLMASYQAHFGQDEHELEHALSEEHRGGTCLTGLVRELKLSWHLFTAEERAEMTSKLAPSKFDLLDPMIPAGTAALGADGPPPPGSCWGEQKDYVIDTEHFSVQWDEGDITLSQAEDFAESLEYSYDIEIDELGWREPTGVSTYKVLIMVERGGGGGAYTTTEYCGGNQLPYVVAYSGSFSSSSGDWYKTMACHELHHAIQFSYGYAHEFWYWEASATWMEDLVYPDLNDWANSIYVYSLVPYMGMNASRTGGGSDEYLFYHTYAMGIWGMFLDEHVGGNELVRDTWDVSRTSNCSYCLWMPDAIERTGQSFDDLYPEFIATNAVMDYEDRLWLRTPELSDEVDGLPAAGESHYSDRPQSLGQNFIKFDASLGGSGDALEITFDGDGSADSWVVVLARGEREIEEYVQMEIDGSMSGVAQIDFPGDAPIHLIVSPINEDDQGPYYNWSTPDDYDYEWSAQLVASTSSGDDDDDDDDDDGSGSSDLGSVAEGDAEGEVIGRKGEGCACSSTRSGQSGWLVLMLGMVPWVRRRR